VLLLAGAMAGWPLYAMAQPDLSRCRAIADPAARLVCYDGLPLTATPAPAQAARAAAPAALAPAAVAAPAATLQGAAAKPALANAMPGAANNAGSSSFGLERAKAAEPQEVVSRISGLFEGWGARTRIRLANGQVWQVVDGSTAALALNEPRVTVRRALMGDFVLEVEGSNRTAKVKRLE
jgi:hypothetical protein